MTDSRERGFILTFILSIFIEVVTCRYTDTLIGKKAFGKDTIDKKFQNPLCHFRSKMAFS